MAEGENKSICGTTLEDRWHNILQTGNLSDQVLRVTCKGDNNVIICRELHVHRIVLGLASPVFERMIYGPMNNKDFIEIHEENIELFHRLLEFIYIRELPAIRKWRMEEIIDLMQMAHRYMVNELVELCGVILIPTIICDLSFTVLNLAIHFNATKLIEECTKLVRDQTQEAFEHQGFTTLSADALVHILKQDNLNVDSELKVFEAAVRWAETYISHSSFSESLPLQNPHYPQTSSPRAKNGNPSLAQIMSGNVSRINNDNASSEMDIAQSCDSGVDVDSNMSDVTSCRVSQIDTMNTEDSTRNTKDQVEEFSVMDETQYSPLEEANEFGKKLREVLQESGALQHIRFLAFSPAEFVTGVTRKNVLTAEEIGHILMTLNINQYKTTIDPTATTSTSEWTSTSDPKDICQIMRRRVNKNSIPDRTDGTIQFYFSHLHWLECPAYVEFEEIFECHSPCPIVIDSVLIPPKQKKKPSMGANYEEELKLTLFTLDDNGGHLHRIAGGGFKCRRKYGETKEYKLTYNMSDKGILLEKGMRFAAKMSFVKEGYYLGGFEFRDECKRNDIIRVPDDKHRGLIHGFKYVFIEQQ